MKIILKYDPNQPRNADGEWSDTGGNFDAIMANVDKAKAGKEFAKGSWESVTSRDRSGKPLHQYTYTDPKTNISYLLKGTHSVTYPFMKNSRLRDLSKTSHILEISLSGKGHGDILRTIRVVGDSKESIAKLSASTGKLTAYVEKVFGIPADKFVFNSRQIGE